MPLTVCHPLLCRRGTLKAPSMASHTHSQPQESRKTPLLPGIKFSYSQLPSSRRYWNLPGLSCSVLYLCLACFTPSFHFLLLTYSFPVSSSPPSPSFLHYFHLLLFLPPCSGSLLPFYSTPPGLYRVVVLVFLFKPAKRPFVGQKGHQGHINPPMWMLCCHCECFSVHCDDHCTTGICHSMEAIHKCKMEMRTLQETRCFHTHRICDRGNCLPHLLLVCDRAVRVCFPALQQPWA